jgi:anti-sigma factor RsiW
MRCNTCRKLRILYEEGALAAPQRAAVQKHLARCPRCREAFREEQGLRALLGVAAAAGPRHDLWPAVAARIRGRQPRPEPLAARVWRPAAVLATVAAAAGLTVALLGRPQPAGDAAAWVEPMVGSPTASRLVYEDPWAGDVARALDSALSEGA